MKVEFCKYWLLGTRKYNFIAGKKLYLYNNKKIEVAER